MDEPILLGRTLAAWLAALTLFTLVLFGTLLVRTFARRFERREDGSIRTLLTGLGHKWLVLTSFALAIGAGAMPMALPERWLWSLRLLLVVAIALQVFVWSRVVIEWAARRYIDKRSACGAEPDPSLLGAIDTFRFVLQALAALLVVLLALENLGVDVTALIAGLGIGGIALALAAQNILGDLFGSLSITLDKPFVVGDFVIVGTEMGTIEHIGLKTTRVRSISGEQLVFSNTDLLKSRIRNFKRMKERRANFSFGVTYQTPVAKLERIPGIVRELVEAQSDVRFERCHFIRFGESTLDFEVVYFVGLPDMLSHLNRLQAILLGLVRRFEEEGIDFAYPTRTLHIATGAISEAVPARS
jgi:small-conductance mechanosensitive channel